MCMCVFHVFWGKAGCIFLECLENFHGLFADKANVTICFGKTCVGMFFFIGVCVLSIGDNTGRCCASCDMAKDTY